MRITLTKKGVEKFDTISNAYWGGWGDFNLISEGYARYEMSNPLDNIDLSPIEEAASVLESAAKHNSKQGRTVMAHEQQGRATQLRQVLEQLNKLKSS